MAVAVNKRKIFFVKEMSDNYDIDISQLRPITREQMEEIRKRSAKESVRSIMKEMFPEKIKSKTKAKK